MAFHEKVKTGKQELQQEQDALLRRYYSDVAKTIVAGMAGDGYKVVVEPAGSPPRVDNYRKIVYLPNPEKSSWEEIRMSRGYMDHEILGHAKQSKPPKGSIDNSIHKIVRNLFEDMRVDHNTCQKYPGSQVNLQELFYIYNQKIEAAQMSKSLAKDIASETLQKGEDGHLKKAKVEDVEKERNAYEDFLELTKSLYARALGVSKPIDRDNTFAKVYDTFKNEPQKCKNSEEVLELSRFATKEIEKLLRLPPTPPEGGMGEEGEDGGAGEGKPNKDKTSKGKSGKGKGKKSDNPGKPKEGESGEEESEGQSEGGDKKPEPEEQEENQGWNGEGNPFDNKDDEEEEGEGEGEGDGEGKGEEEEGESDNPGKADRAPHDLEDTDLRSKPLGSEFKSKPSYIDTSVFEKFLEKTGEKFDPAKVIQDSFTGERKSSTDYTAYKDNDRIIQVEPLLDYTRVKQLLKKSSGVYGRLYARMVRMYKQVKPMPVRNLEKGSLVGGDAYRAVVFGDTDIFERKINVESYDIAYSLLIDLSGSMSGTNLYTAIQTACLMGQVLAALNIPFEVVGFTSDGSGGGHAGFLRTTPLRHFVFKPFEERLSWKLFGRLENVLIGHISCSQNVDGEAVEWACKRLLPRKEKKRVLIVLSDGQPADGITPYDALHRHLKDMVEQYTKMGVVLIGIGMHTDAPANFYKNYVLLSDLNELPKTVIDQVERFIEKGR